MDSDHGSVVRAGVVALALALTVAAEAAPPELARSAGTPRVGAMDATDREGVPAGLVADLLNWIERNTDYDVEGIRTAPPDFVLVSTGEEIHYEHSATAVWAALRAAYDEHARRIFLVRPWRAQDLHHRSTLLHELVHDAQYRNRRWACRGRAEWEAYKLQERWLKEHGVGSGFDWRQLFVLARCRRDMHP